MEPAATEYVLVAKDELEALRRLKEELPEMLQKARHSKENPDKHRERSKKRYEQNKEDILAKRREAYRLKKEAAADSPRTSSADAENVPCSSATAEKSPGTS